MSDHIPVQPSTMKNKSAIKIVLSVFFILLGCILQFIYKVIRTGGVSPFLEKISEIAYFVGSLLGVAALSALLGWIIHLIIKRGLKKPTSYYLYLAMCFLVLSLIPFNNLKPVESTPPIISTDSIIINNDYVIHFSGTPKLERTQPVGDGSSIYAYVFEGSDFVELCTLSKISDGILSKETTDHFLKGVMDSTQETTQTKINFEKSFENDITYIFARYNVVLNNQTIPFSLKAFVKNGYGVSLNLICSNENYKKYKKFLLDAK